MSAQPPPIALDDLDRAELLRLLSGRFMAFTASDMWRVRWEVLSERAAEARAKASDALGAYLGAMPEALSPSTRTSRQAIRELREQETRRSAYQRAKAKANRAEAAEERAWRALEACDRRRIIA